MPARIDITLLAAHAAFGLLPGVDRPALATTIPTLHRGAVLLDAGANVECRPQHLVQFGAMGRVCARLALGIAEPMVGLLSIGEEASKGNELTRDAHRLLQSSGLDFVGNVEARDVYTGQADVIVCDGFTGNLALKISEGLGRGGQGAVAGGTETKRLPRASAACCHVWPFDVFADGWTTPKSGGRRCWVLPGCVSSGTVGRPSKAVRNAVAMAYRFAGQGFVERVVGEIAAVPA